MVAGTSNRDNTGRGTFRAADITLNYRREWARQQGPELTASAVYTPSLNDNAVNSRPAYAASANQQPHGAGHRANPFIDRTDQPNLVAGGRSLGTTVFYRLETATLKPFRQVITDPLTGNLVTLTTRLNVGDETSYGLEVVGATPLAAFWKVNGTASAFRRTIRGSTTGTTVNTASLAFTGRLNNTFSFSKRLDAQLAINYRSPINSVQGMRGENFNVDAAARYNVLGEHGTFTLRVADIFNTLRCDSSDGGADFATVTRFKRESRIAYLGLTYRFGQNAVARAKPKKESDEAGGFD